MIRLAHLAVLSGLSAALLSCSGSSPTEPAPPPDTSVSRTGDAQVAPSPSPSPSPSPVGPGSIAYIRVGFYGVECYNGQTAPNNGARRLPVGCFGYVTATPKQSNGQDVDSAEHGPDIAWELVQGEQQVKVMEVPNQKFNKLLKGRSPGPFSLCATVRTVTGCLDGTVVP
jgi:hypothetical protein